MPQPVQHKFAGEANNFFAVHNRLTDLAMLMIEARDENWRIRRIAGKDPCGAGLFSTGKEDSGSPRRERERPLSILALSCSYLNGTEPRPPHRLKTNILPTQICQLPDSQPCIEHYDCRVS